MSSTQDILNKAKEMGVKFIRLQFTDIHGVLKNVAITINQLPKALAGELMFDGSSVSGFTNIEESDMCLMPDHTTFDIFPWRPRDEAVARLVCDIYNPDGTPFEGCPRNNLKRVLQEAALLGYSMKVGPEAEFFFLQAAKDGSVILAPQDRAGYFDMPPTDYGFNARRDIVLTLEEMGFEIEASHHEVADGQHEIDFKYDDALTTADKIQTFKLVVRTVAQRHGLHATFMPKPFSGINGSGMHTNQSLFIGKQNAFFEPDAPDQLSLDAYHYIGGLLQHASSYTAVTNPIVNSYKRLVPGYEAPVYIAWSGRNRSPLIRIPAKRGLSTRVELRSPDPACNPYLALAVMLKAGLDGIKNRIKPPASVDRNIYQMTEAERAKLNIGSLPASLEEALAELAKSPVMREALGPHIYEKFMEIKRREWDDYRTKVHPWEITEYLTKY